ncbi:hypothetical protein [Sorangium atrum]|uniref:Secreted protein n=1 Tax=Sorangium atrum TaxID=2995308 RepID=A0ABT5C3F5_9BACT|nr:hypothetical protein [Sorangium aterium]MDC0680380.1 hypothetical protein [Sorangium aterium]
MYHVKMGRQLAVGVHARAAALAALLGAVCFSSSASAQPKKDDAEGKQDDSAAAEKQATDEKAQDDKAPGEKEKPQEAPPEAADDNAPFEREGKTYRFAGLRFRNLIVPKAMINLFADGGASVNVFTFGPELATRRDGLEIDLAISYADYSMDPFLFKGKNDGNDAWEMVSSDMKLVYFTTDLLYEIPLDKEKGRFSLLIGGGVGLGVVFGNLYRAQAYPNNPSRLDPDDVGSWSKCAGPTGGFCDGSNDHFGNYDEPSWINGGSKPSVFPWISFPQLSFRYKPIKQLQTRLDAGFSITGLFFGLSAGYGL